MARKHKPIFIHINHLKETSFMKHNKKTIPAFALAIAAAYGRPNCAADDAVA